MRSKVLNFVACRIEDVISCCNTPWQAACTNGIFTRSLKAAVDSGLQFRKVLLEFLLREVQQINLHLRSVSVSTPESRARANWTQS
jgi:hypothetical protein